MHQFWRNLFYVVGHCLIWGIDIIHSTFLVTAKQLFLSRGLAELIMIMGSKGLPRKENCCRCDNIKLILIVKLDFDNFHLSPMLLKM